MLILNLQVFRTPEIFRFVPPGTQPMYQPGELAALRNRAAAAADGSQASPISPQNEDDHNVDI